MSALISLAATILPLLTILSGSVRLDRPLSIGGTDHYLQYDDGTAHWLSWSGLYRGVWYDLDDFTPGLPGAEWDMMELWFYHHASFPWDTGSFYAELYNGDEAGPMTQLDQTSVTAAHYAPCYANYSSPIWTEASFWGLMNTEMSSGGWPSILGDNTPNGTGNDHSFYSDDFIEWTPWVPGAAWLERETWGGVKALYGCSPLETPGCCDYFIRMEAGIGSRETLCRE